MSKYEENIKYALESIGDSHQKDFLFSELMKLNVYTLNEFATLACKAADKKR